MRSIVNANQCVQAYSDYLGPEQLITDLSYQVSLGTPSKSRAEAQAWLQNRVPNAQIGVYCSSRDAVPANQQPFDPPRALGSDLFVASEYFDFKNHLVDYRQPAARAKLVTGLVNRAVETQSRWLFADNWSYPGSWPGFISWPETINYMTELRSALASRGIGLICNVAIEPAGASQADLVALGNSCDGVSLEMAALPVAVNNPAGLARLVTAYQTLLGTGCRVITCQNFENVQQFNNESRFMAGLAMILDGPMVGYPFWLPPQDWFTWPAQFGRPIGPIQQNGTLLSRAFERGVIQIDGANRTVSARLGVADTHRRKRPALSRQMLFNSATNLPAIR